MSDRGTRELSTTARHARPDGKRSSRRRAARTIAADALRRDEAAPPAPRPPDGAGESGAMQPRLGDRRTGTRRADDLERRVTEIENMARGSRRELELQFLRIAHIQADLDRLLKSVRATPRPPDLPQGDPSAFDDPAGRAIKAAASVPALPERRRF